MDKRSIERMHHVTAWVTITALIFWQFFALSKGGPFRDINPFGEDPYDAVGSIAFQIALLVGLLTYARALRLRETPAPDPARIRLVLHGNIVVLSAILITLIVDAIAEVVRPFPRSYWGDVLALAHGLMFVLTLLSVFAVFAVFRRIPSAPLLSHLTPADGFDDLWTLVRIPVTWGGAVLPRALVKWVKGFNSDKLFCHLRWADPRRHAWRFACFLGFGIGITLCLAELQEGVPSNLKTGLLVACIFVAVEMAAIVLGYAALGRYLGLRPSLKKVDR